MERSRFHAAEDDADYNELFNAAMDGNVSRLRAALKPTLDVNALQADPFEGVAALHMAAGYGHVDTIRFLLAHGANVHLRSAYDETPLIHAASGAHLEAVQTLLDAGAHIGTRCGDERTNALFSVLANAHAVTSRHIKTVELFLDRGYDVNAPVDSWGSELVSIHPISPRDSASDNTVD